MNSDENSSLWLADPVLDRVISPLASSLDEFQGLLL